jgi:hypothetical protein
MRTEEIPRNRGEEQGENQRIEERKRTKNRERSGGHNTGEKTDK